MTLTLSRHALVGRFGPDQLLEGFARSGHAGQRKPSRGYRQAPCDICQSYPWQRHLRPVSGAEQKRKRLNSRVNDVEVK
jgi:hypothetical protein